MPSAKQNAARRASYRSNRAKGLCDRCFSAPSRPGKAMCQACADKHGAVNDATRWRRLGIDINVTIDAANRQGGLCAICHQPPKEKKGRLHIDHDHETGVFRAMLCGNCNRGLGIFQDSAELLRAAALYLDSHKRKVA